MAEEEFSLANGSGPSSSPGIGSCDERNCRFLPSNWKQSHFKMEFFSTFVFLLKDPVLATRGNDIQQQNKLTNYRTDMTTFTGYPIL